jgi:ethanolaminephosphotransferase
MLSLSTRNKHAVKSYVYNGGDSSLTYKYVLSPFAQFCVDMFIPIWMAPNLITTLGLTLTTLNCIAVIVWNPYLSEDCPRWLHLLSAISIFGYQTLDNMDGKQARRTKSSNALGMLFDHSCDVLNTVIIGLIMASVVATGWTMKIFLGFICGYVPFYFQTWEEYHLGTMVLPIFNGPSEGLLMAISICLISYFMGCEWWNRRQVRYN